ncbi:MAG: hypothetical protein ACRD6X_02650 [Pyrinomonadaceae bacterium]
MPVMAESNSTDETSEGFLNVGATVGKNGVNYVGDVFLVQAMLYEVLPYLYGITPEALPYPTGTYEGRTAHSILQYQEMSSRSRGVKIWKDGFIDRAKGSHVPGKKRVWTITYMNEDLYYVHSYYGYEGSYSQWLMNQYPELAYYFGGYN